MWEGPNLYRALSEEWRSAGTGTTARAALRRWAAADAVLAGLADPAAVVLSCHRRDKEGADALLAAVIRHAPTDPLACRTVLQVVLPGLAAISRRLGRFVGPGKVWAQIDEVDQHVVAVAYERICALAPAPPRWLANAVVDGTWQRVRWYARRQSAMSRRRTVLPDDGDMPAPVPPGPGSELAEVLADALELGVIEELDAYVVFHSRVSGVTIPVLAADVGLVARRLWRRRERAEQQLASMASAPPLAASTKAV